MTELTYTLLGDGPSDEVLLRHLAWLIGQHLSPEISTRPQWGDLRACRERPIGLAQRIRTALILYPCDLLFVHRDAENQMPQTRYDEIQRAIEQNGVGSPPAVCVIRQSPRFTEERTALNLTFDSVSTPEENTESRYFMGS